MNIDLERTDIVNLIAALNNTQEYALADGDVVKLVVYQTSGGALAMIGYWGLRKTR